MASAVILLSTGPTVMNASMVGSRTISAVWSMPNCVTVTLSGSTRFLEDDAQQLDIDPGPADHADAAAGETVDGEASRRF